ncbi:ATP-binding protein [Pilimelia columellifera]|uniref:Histidine kinase/HSP90-like ATPase domain-containing protein n=1 Tax=Pilimelia columellifera subsp. columellifera TaxID=706583 RepID=A0ABN3N7N9_9ACTN
MVPGAAAAAGSGPAAAGRELLRGTFDQAGVTTIRHQVSQHVAAVGLTGQRRDDFILAVNELVTNAVRHGGGIGQLRLWLADGALLCEIVDHGGGIAVGGAAGHERPPVDLAGGWGLWLARQLTDGMTVDTGDHGTTIRLRAAI